jgi:hypothetical protein
MMLFQEFRVFGRGDFYGIFIHQTHLFYFPSNQSLVTKYRGINKGVNDSCLVQNFVQFWQVF